jgi:predicted glycosyltransferase
MTTAAAGDAPRDGARAHDDPRVLLYSHDSYGLGHLRRTLALAGAIAERDSRASTLILTGSTVASSYRLPPRCDTVKLPVLRKRESGRYESLRLRMGFDGLRELRASIALAVAEAYAPTALVIDKTPLGLRGEMVPTLEALSARGGCRRILGLRDVEDSPPNVRREWRGRRTREAIRRHYDAVLVYGPASSMDALDCMGWPT